MRNYFVIGGGLLQLDFIRKVKERGFIAHVFDYDNNCPGKDICDKFHHVSITDKTKILEIAKRFKPVGIQTVATEMGNRTASFVGEKLNLKVNSFTTSIETSDKNIMKEVFTQNKIPSTKSVVLINSSQLPNLKFPFMVKASDRSAGRGIRLVRNESEFRIAFIEALDQSVNKIVLAEEFFYGKQYSIETISFSGEHYVIAVTDENVDGPPYFVEVMHLLPAMIDIDLYKKIETIIFRVLDAFKIQHGASHIELLVNENAEINIIEVASRMGGYREKMILNSIGIDYLDLIIDSSIGAEVEKRNLLVKSKDFSIIKWIATKKDFEIFSDTLENEPDLIVEWSVDSSMITARYRATNLVETAGYYILKLNPELVNKFFNR
jgi:biotin carboxylase